MKSGVQSWLQVGKKCAETGSYEKKCRESPVWLSARGRSPGVVQLVPWKRRAGLISGREKVKLVPDEGVVGLVQVLMVQGR